VVLSELTNFWSIEATLVWEQHSSTQVTSSSHINVDQNDSHPALISGCHSHWADQTHSILSVLQPVWECGQNIGPRWTMLEMEVGMSTCCHMTAHLTQSNL